MKEEELDNQILALFDHLRIDDDDYRHWAQTALRQYTESERPTSRDRRALIKRQPAEVVEEQDWLLTLRLHDEIDADTDVAKSTELRDRGRQPAAANRDCRPGKGRIGRESRQSD